MHYIDTTAFIDTLIKKYFIAATKQVVEHIYIINRQITGNLLLSSSNNLSKINVSHFVQFGLQSISLLIMVMRISIIIIMLVLYVISP